MIRRLFIGVFLLCVLGLQIGGGIVAQEDGSSGQKEDQSAGESFLVKSRRFDSWLEDEDRITFLTGASEIWSERFRIRGNTIVGWFDTAEGRRARRGDLPDDAGNARKRRFDRLYAEGSVQFRRGDAVFTADRLYFNFKTNRGIAVDAEYRTQTSMNVSNETRTIPVIVRAEQLKQLSKKTIVAEEASFTTCTYDDPHYVLGAETVTLNTSGDTDSVEMQGIVPKLEGVPFMYVPFVFFSRGSSGNSPLQRFDIGSSSRLGGVVRTKWNQGITRAKRDKNGEIIRNDQGEPVKKKWGDLGLRADYMSERGLALGPTLDYEWNNYEGFLDTYYLNDEGPDPDNDFDRRFLPQEQDNRGRFWAFHRHNFIDEEYENLRLDTELKWISDQHFQPEFFEEEHKEGKAEETYGYLRYTKDNQFAKALVRPRINSFLTQTERMPEVEYSIYGEKFNIGSRPVHYTSETQIGNLNRRPGKDVRRVEGLRTWRLDSYHEFTSPFSVGPVRVTPLLGLRGSLYDNANQGGASLGRFIGTGGVRLNTNFHRTYDYQNKSLGIRGLRHVIDLETKYTNNFEASHPADNLPDLDTVDQQEEFEEVSLSIRNRFETKDSEGEPYEFLSVGLGTEFYPDVSQIRGRAREQNYLFPFNAIPTRVDPETGAVNDRNFSDVFLDVEYDNPGPFEVDAQVEYDPHQEDITGIRSQFTYKPTEATKLDLKHEFVRDVADVMDLSYQMKLTERWGLRGQVGYDFFEGGFEDILATLRYNFHDFVVDLGFVVDDGKDERALTFSVAPRFLATSFQKWIFGSYSQKDLFNYDASGYHSGRR